MRHLRRTGQARRRDMARTLYYLARYKLGLLDVERALGASMAWISGRVEELVQRDCEAWYARTVRPYIYPAMAAAVEAHRRPGHVPAILTSATRYLAEPVAADGGRPVRRGGGMGKENGRRRSAPARTLVKPLLLLATGAAAGVVLWRALMLDPSPAQVGTERLSEHDRQALDGVLQQRSVRP